MRNVRCHECGKRYNYDVDDFCPRCGAFTQPVRTSRIGVDGTVVRVDGINEQNHKNSFVHAELHGENRKRRGTHLEAGVSRKLIYSKGDRHIYEKAQSTAGRKGSAGVIGWIVFAIIAFNVLSQLLVIFL